MVSNDYSIYTNKSYDVTKVCDNWYMAIWRKYLHMQKQLKKTKIKNKSYDITKVNWYGDLTKIFMQKQLKKTKANLDYTKQDWMDVKLDRSLKFLSS